ncbi:MAG: DUF692 family protein [Rhodoferax sp.]|nr:DUF692 family protein [Rhodoferax sp.]
MNDWPASTSLECSLRRTSFFGDGGANSGLQLKRARQHYPISLHGVGLSLGAVTGLDLTGPTEAAGAAN